MENDSSSGKTYCLGEEALQKMFMAALSVWSDWRKTGLMCDVTLLTDDGGTFLVHRTIMAQCSEYFKALFTTKLNPDSQKTTTFSIPNVTASVLDIVINFAYQGTVDVTEDNVTDLIIAADQFSVLEMLKGCCDFLESQMDYTNCIGFREFAKIYFLKDLEEKTHKFILKNFPEITKYSEEYLEMESVQVLQILNSDYINVKNEEEVWEAGLRWIEHSPGDRQKFTHAIMRCVRLGLLETNYFLEKVKLNKYVERNKLCKPIIIETLKFLWDLETIGTRQTEAETPFLATPRIPYSILFCIGGWAGGAPTTLVNTYDTKADRWVKINEIDPLGPRAYHKLAVIGFDIYVIGGFNGTDYFSSCRCFNTVTKQWKEIAPMNNKRCYVSVAVVGDTIYAMGGYDGHHRQNTAERYDIAANQWYYIAPMNMQRSDASATVLNGKIYIVGGFNGSECLPSCECYDPSTDQWTYINQMQQRRSGVSAIAHHGYVFALGGFNGVTRLASCEKYNPDTDQWCAVKGMFNQRSNFAVEIMDDMILAIGGFNGNSTIAHVECFNDIAEEWYEATDLDTLRSALAACVVHGLPNVHDYTHPNRRGLLEEKRQKLIQQAEEARRTSRRRNRQHGNDVQNENGQNLDQNQQDAFQNLFQIVPNNQDIVRNLQNLNIAQNDQDFVQNQQDLDQDQDLLQ